MSPTPTHHRHARFYLPRGTDIFLVENTLYKLHTDLLGLQGGPLQDLLELPQTVQDREGLTDDKPIVLPQVSEREFEHYLEFVYEGHMLPPYPIQKLVDVLKMSTQWDVDAGRRWAIHYLEKADTFPPALRLNLARRYEVPEWIEPAFRSLIFEIPLVDLAQHDLDYLGFKVYVLITKVKAMVEKERRVVAFCPPEVSIHNPLCPHNARCATIWRETWKMRIGRRLLDPEPEKELSFAAAPDTMRAVEWAGVFPACREEMLRRHSDGAGFRGAEEIFLAALTKLSELPLE